VAKLAGGFTFLVALMLCVNAYASGERAPELGIRLSALFQPEEPQGEPAAAEKAAEEKTRKFGLPGWWGYKRTANARSTAFLPFYYGYRDDKVAMQHFWPLYGWKKTTDSTAHPLNPTVRYPPYDTRYVLWPFFRYTSYADGAKQVDFPWPFNQVYAGPKKFGMHLFPLLWVSHAGRSDSSVVFFPLYWHFFREKSRARVIFPVYWDIKVPEGRLWHLWPIYGYSKGKGYSCKLFGFPLLRYIRRWEPDKPPEDQPADRQVDLVWPFVKLRLGPLNKQFHLFPLYYGKTYYHDKEENRTKLFKRYCYLLPLFWYYSDREERHFHLWPFGISRTHDGSLKKIHIAFPLLSIFTRKSDELVEVSFPTFISLFKYQSRAEIVDYKEKMYMRKGRSVSVRLFPLFSYRKNSLSYHLSVNPIFAYNSSSVTGYSRFTLVGGLLFLHQKMHTRLAWHLLLGLTSYNRMDNGDRSFRMLFWQCKWEKEKTVWQFEPLFHYRSDKKGYDMRFLTGLFGFGKRDNDGYLRLFWVKF
jgi:hypothetical protein